MDVEFHRRWTLEAYLGCKLEPSEMCLRVDPKGRGDEEISVDGSEYEVGSEKREVVRAGYGHLDYLRVKGEGFSGW